MLAVVVGLLYKLLCKVSKFIWWKVMTLKHGRVFVIAPYLLTNFHNSFRFFIICGHRYPRIIIHHSFQGSHPKVSTPKNCCELVLNYMIKYNTIKKNALFYQPYYILLLAKPNLCNKILVTYIIIIG